MPYFCHLDTGGTANHTNLQLYSLQMVAESWNDLARHTEWCEQDGCLNERAAFILSCLGLSLSQLLGQNNPFPEKEKIDSPRFLVDKVQENAGVDAAKRIQLLHRFNEFLDYYDTVRHFGRSNGGEKHRIVSQLTFAKLTEFRQMTTDIWDSLIADHRKNPENELDEFWSIASVVGFEDAFAAEYD